MWPRDLLFFKKNIVLLMDIGETILIALTKNSMTPKVCDR